MPGVSVTVTNTQTNAARTVQTNSAGSYVFPTLLPGIYNVRVEVQGFQTKVANAVELQVQQTARLDFALELGTVEVAVEVTGSAPMINATDATVGTVIENRQILEMPLNGRNFINLVSLSPNVSSDYAGGGGGERVVAVEGVGDALHRHTVGLRARRRGLRRRRHRAWRLPAREPDLRAGVRNRRRCAWPEDWRSRDRPPRRARG